MIIARITSGLGNQLFQYAAGRALATVRGTPLVLDTRWYREKHNRAAHEVFGLRPYLGDWREAQTRDLCWVRGRPRTAAERLRIAFRRGVGLLIGERPRRIKYARDGDFSYDERFFALPDETYLDGNWQSEAYFRPVAAELRALIDGYQPASSAKILATKITASGNSAFLHVRRGDYVSHAHFAREIGALSAQYYQRSLEALRTSVGPCDVFVFTNDESWVQREFDGVGNTLHIVPSSIAAPQDVLHLMRHCRHAIIANSSLSWWGAWLAERPGQFVAAPTPWFADSWRNTRDLLCAHWQTFPR